MKINLVDTFNGYTISSHRTLLAAIKAGRKHNRAVKRANGRDSYIPVAYVYADGTKVPSDLIYEARQQIDRY